MEPSSDTTRYLELTVPGEPSQAFQKRQQRLFKIKAGIAVLATILFIFGGFRYYRGPDNPVINKDLGGTSSQAFKLPDRSLRKFGPKDVPQGSCDLETVDGTLHLRPAKMTSHSVTKIGNKTTINVGGDATLLFQFFNDDVSSSVPMSLKNLIVDCSGDACQHRVPELHIILMSYRLDREAVANSMKSGRDALVKGFSSTEVEILAQRLHWVVTPVWEASADDCFVQKIATDWSVVEGRLRYSESEEIPTKPIDGYWAPTWYSPKISGKDLELSGLGRSIDTACEEVPKAAESGFIALIQRGKCSLYSKAKRAQDAGAIAAVVYGDDDDFGLGCKEPDPCSTDLEIMPVIVSKSVGEDILAKLHANGENKRRRLDGIKNKKETNTPSDGLTMYLSRKIDDLPKQVAMLALGGGLRFFERRHNSSISSRVKEIEYLLWEHKIMRRRRELEQIAEDKPGQAKVVEALTRVPVKGPGWAEYKQDVRDIMSKGDWDRMQLELYLECKDHLNSNCGPWDFLLNLRLCTGNPEKSGDKKYECYDDSRVIGRWITPYGREGHWISNATPAIPVLQNQSLKDTKFFFHMWGNVELYMTVNFLLWKDPPKTSRGRVLGRQFLWGFFHWNYEEFYKNMKDIEFTPPTGTKKVILSHAITGHGWGWNVSNCAEFCDSEHQFQVNGKGTIVRKLSTAVQCGDQVFDGVVPYQTGTWEFGRAGWCPGKQVDWIEHDVTDDVNLEEGGANSVEYKALKDGKVFEPKEKGSKSSNAFPPEIQIVSTLTFYGNPGRGSGGLIPNTDPKTPKAPKLTPKLLHARLGKKDAPPSQKCELATVDGKLLLDPDALTAHEVTDGETRIVKLGANATLVFQFGDGQDAVNSSWRGLVADCSEDPCKLMEPEVHFVFISYSQDENNIAKGMLKGRDDMLQGRSSSETAILKERFHWVTTPFAEIPTESCFVPKIVFDWSTVEGHIKLGADDSRERTDTIQGDWAKTWYSVDVAGRDLNGPLRWVGTACDELESSADLAASVALVERGGCSLYSKATKVREAGSFAVIFFGVADGDADAGLGCSSPDSCETFVDILPVIVSKSAGESILDKFYPDWQSKGKAAEPIHEDIALGSTVKSKPATVGVLAWGGGLRLYDERGRAGGYQFSKNIEYMMYEHKVMDKRRQVERRALSEPGQAVVVDALNKVPVKGTGWTTFDPKVQEVLYNTEWDRLHLELHLDCEDHSTSKCGPWDFLLNLRLCSESSEEGRQPYECYADDRVVGRWVTPYGREGHWISLATPSISLLRDRSHKDDKFFFHMWGDVTIYMSVKFILEKDPPETWRGHPLGRQWLWSFFHWNYEEYYKDLKPVEFTPPPGTKKVIFGHAITGHGWGWNSSNCAEFCDSEHHFKINDKQDIVRELLTNRQCKDQVLEGTVPYQSGTWEYSRAGWCPGKAIDWIEVDVTDDVILNGKNSMAYQALKDGQIFEPKKASYVNSTAFKPEIMILTVLNFYGDPPGNQRLLRDVDLFRNFREMNF